MKCKTVTSITNKENMCISVVLNCYNEQNYVAEAIESILNQTAVENILEIVIVDDGSQDSTPAIVSRYAESNKKIKFIKQNNYGIPCARNTGVRHSASTWVAFLDGDDIWVATKIEKQLKIIKENPEIDFIYGDSYTFNKRSDILRRTRSFNQLGKYQEYYYFLLGQPIVPSSVMLKRSCFDNAAGFDESFLCCHDTEFWLRLLPDCKFFYLSEPIFYRRQHNSSISSNALRKIQYQKLLCRVAPQKNEKLAFLKESRESVFLMAQAIELGKESNLKSSLLCASKSFSKSLLWCWYYMIPRGRRFYCKLLAKLKIEGLAGVTYKALQKAHGGRNARY